MQVAGVASLSDSGILLVCLAVACRASNPMTELVMRVHTTAACGLEGDCVGDLSVYDVARGQQLPSTYHFQLGGRSLCLTFSMLDWL